MNFSLRRVWAVTWARNLEFLRDRSSVGWNLLLPVLLVFGLAYAFSGPEKPLFKVAVLVETSEAGIDSPAIDTSMHPFLSTRYIQFFTQTSLDQDSVDRARERVSRHQLDMLLDISVSPARYWVNDDSPKGYFLEKLLQVSEMSLAASTARRQSVSGEQLRYVDWLLPGILGMNMMFSCLFGVGYVIVRYRMSGYLKRLHATPLTAFEFITAQVVSRLVLILLITAIIYVGTDYFIGFRMEGSFLLLGLITVLGATAMIAMGLTVAARVTSEELAGGLLNMLTWPMMFLSGVWFSLEGSPQILRDAAQFLPLTHLLDGARAIMLDGAGLTDVMHHLVILASMTLVFVALGAWMFRWQRH